MSFGIEGLHMCTTEHYLLHSKQSMMEFAKDVRKGRIQRRHFLAVKAKPKSILEIIHSDVCGPMSSNSLSGYAYYVSFIDDFYRKAWIYFMKNKYEVFSKFKEFKSLIENHTEK